MVTTHSILSGQLTVTLFPWAVCTVKSITGSAKALLGCLQKMAHFAFSMQNCTHYLPLAAVKIVVTESFLGNIIIKKYDIRCQSPVVIGECAMAISMITGVECRSINEINSKRFHLAAAM